MADFRLGADLALVETGVARLHVFDLQRPRVGAVHVEALEALVCDERVPVHGEDVRVPVTNPGYLRRREEGGHCTDWKRVWSIRPSVC